jgi:hypothetical protein
MQYRSAIRIRAIRRLTASVLAVVFTAGCGDSGPVPDIIPTVPVSGTLTYNGKPVPSFKVVFSPTDGRKTAMGTTDADGKFTLGTNQPGDGAAVGTHKVTVAYDPPPEVDSAVAMPIESPAKMPKPAVEVPAKYTKQETSDLVQEVTDDGLPDVKIELK